MMIHVEIIIRDRMTKKAQKAFYLEVLEVDMFPSGNDGSS